MLLEFFTILLSLGLIVAVCIGCEKIIHPKFDLAECTRKFKADLGKILHVLFGSNTERHIFDTSLWEHFLEILKEYVHDAFTPSCQADFYDGTPRICISFVPNRELAPNDLNRLCKLLCLKLSQYLQLYGLHWRLFAEYNLLDNTVVVNLYYAEFKEDFQPFLKRYRIAVRRKAAGGYGVLHDEALDKEINNGSPRH